MTFEPTSFGTALLASIHSGASPLQIAHDPDRLLLDEVALARLGERGFAVLRWRDEVTFRFEYETRFRESQPEREAPTIPWSSPRESANQVATTRGRST